LNVAEQGGDSRRDVGRRLSDHAWTQTRILEFIHEGFYLLADVLDLDASAGAERGQLFHWFL
jgi:hypothetical protein